MQRPKYFNALDKIFCKLNNYFKNNWRLAVLDLNAGRWLVETYLSNKLYLKAENAHGRHILMQPVNEEYFILADDINPELLQLNHKNIDGSWKKGRLVVETSPCNYQVWINSSRALNLREKKHWLAKMHSDPGATPTNRWGRMPGFRNRKQKYKSKHGLYPLAKLIWVDWRYRACVPKLQFETKSKNHSGQYKSNTRQYNYNIYRKSYDKGNESITDFSYALALARRGCDFHTIKSRIIYERDNWSNHLSDNQLNDYLNRTVKKAMNIVSSS